MNVRQLQEQIKRMNGYSFYYKYRSLNKRLVIVTRIKDGALRYALVKEMKLHGMRVCKIERVTVTNYLKQQLLIKIGFIYRVENK